PAAVTPWLLTLTPSFHEAMLPAPSIPAMALSYFKTAVPPALGAAAAGAHIASARDARGWRMELALPRTGLPAAHQGTSDILLLAIVAVSSHGPAAGPGGMVTVPVGMLSARNRPFNPATFTEVVLPR
ncbi:MAG TPA: hypothetical protein VF832_02315, partial [Longimicrobiales bacterium]